MPLDPSPDSVDRFAADLLADERIAAASRRRSLRRQADESDRWSGMLATLAERAEVVTVELTGDRRVVGSVVLVGDDVVGLRSTAGLQVLVAATAVAGIRLPEETARPVTGDRPTVAGASMAACLRNLIERAATVSIRAGGAPIQGRLRSCGDDVVVLAGTAGQVLVPLGNVTEVVVDDAVR